MMKKLWMLIAWCILCGGSVNAQVLLSEDFAAGLPAGWKIQGPQAVQWAAHPTLGINGSGCMMVDDWQTVGGNNINLETVAVDLTTINNPKISFKLASIRSNFIAPRLVLYYSTGSGWQKLANWGEWQTDFIISTTGPCNMPLPASCIDWEDITYDLSKIAHLSNVRFAFQADVPNGGFVLLDDVWVHDKKVYSLPYLQDFDQQVFFPKDWERYGSDAKADWQRSATVGFGGNNTSTYFDNYSVDVSGKYYGMRMVWLDLSTAANPALTFEYAYAKRKGKPADKFGIWYKIHDTGTWRNLKTFEDPQIATTPEISAVFVPNSRDWRQETIDLSQLKGYDEVRFAIECNSAHGNILYVDNIHFYNNTTTSVAQVEEGNSYRIYPNPAGNRLYIDTRGSTINKYTVYDITGRKVYSSVVSTSNSVVSVPLHSFKSGLYYIKLYDSKGKMVTHKFVVKT